MTPPECPLRVRGGRNGDLPVVWFTLGPDVVGFAYFFREVPEPDVADILRYPYADVIMRRGRTLCLRARHRRKAELF
jgi:hypothetical protein